ncbi:MAG TPA: GYD domain-containing protein [Anaerolineales bacterium]
MATYLMFGKYSLESAKAISTKRTVQAMDLIKKNGGQIKASYVLLGEVDLVLVVDLPDTEHAMQTSVALAKLLGVSFTTAPAITAEEFDKLMG